MKLTIEPESRSHEGKVMGTGEPYTYRVVGLLDGAAKIAQSGPNTWKIWRDPMDTDWRGDYDNPEDALAALEAEVAEGKI